MSVTPSTLIGLKEGSYEAYCLNQATWYLGTFVTGEIEKVGQKKAKGQAGTEAARKRKLEQLLGIEQKKTKGTYADPALLFAN